MAVRLTLDDDDRPEHRQFVESKMAEARQLVRHGHGEYFEPHPEHRRQGHARAMLHAAADTERQVQLQRTPR